jgi:hypothetical protein
MIVNSFITINEQVVHQLCYAYSYKASGPDFGESYPQS